MSATEGSNSDSEVEYSSVYSGSEKENFVEVEVQASYVPEADSDSDEDEMANACADDPIADADWVAQYEKEMQETRELEERLTKRLHGTERVGEWCSCGNCERESLQNLSECYCCRELDGCLEAMSSEIVLQDLPPETMLTCITQHPGFSPVCLQKWSLRLAADKYKTKEKKRYRQTESEER